MTMRVFAYGGSRYELRNRLGEWPAEFADTAAFENLHALPIGGAVAFGVGLRPGPVLILRQRQTQGDRGGYAYTVMLDPGRDVWQRFGWNGGALLLAARANAALWRALLDEPERLAESFLETHVGQLASGPVPAVTRSVATGRAESVLVDSGVTSAPALLPSGSGLDSPELAAALLWRLPPAFRCSRGWMSGGHAGAHAAFGTAVIVDPHVASPHADGWRASDYAETLETVLREHLSAPLEALLDTPIHEWTEHPPHVAAQWRALARAFEGTLGPEITDVGRDDLLHADIRRVLTERAALDQQRWSREVSAWMLRGHESLARVPTAVARRLDVGALAAYLDERGIAPTDPALQSLPLSDEDRLALWSALIALAPGGQVVGLIADAATVTHAEPERWAAWLETVARGVTRRPRSEQPALSDWQALRQYDPVWRRVAPQLTAAVRGGSPDGDDWALAYVTHGGDDGASWLLSAHGASQVAAVADLAIVRVADPRVGGLAREWLDGLARSTARRQLPLSLKLRIAQAVDGDWRPLLLLIDLLTGEPVLTSLQARSRDEQAALLDELHAALDEYSRQDRGAPTTAIDFAKITALVNAPLPSGTIARMIEHFVVDDAGVAWLRDNGHDDVARETWRSNWHRLPATSAAVSAADLQPLLMHLSHQRAAATHVVALLSSVNAAAVTEIVNRDRMLRSWLAEVLFEPKTTLPYIASIAKRFEPEMWTPLLDALTERGSRRLVDVMGVVGRHRLPWIGRVVFSYLADRHPLRDEVAVQGWGEPWDVAMRSIRAAIVFDEDGSVPEPPNPPRAMR
jgi:hypothetical protein